MTDEKVQANRDQLAITGPQGGTSNPPPAVLFRRFSEKITLAYQVDLRALEGDAGMTKRLLFCRSLEPPLLRHADREGEAPAEPEP